MSPMCYRQTNHQGRKKKPLRLAAVDQQALRKSKLLVHRFFRRTAFSTVIARADHRTDRPYSYVRNRFVSLFS
jgi:hypothetical protein